MAPYARRYTSTSTYAHRCCCMKRRARYLPIWRALRCTAASISYSSAMRSTEANMVAHSWPWCDSLALPHLFHCVPSPSLFLSHVDQGNAVASCTREQESDLNSSTHCPPRALSVLVDLPFSSSKSDEQRACVHEANLLALLTTFQGTNRQTRRRAKG